MAPVPPPPPIGWGIEGEEGETPGEAPTFPLDALVHSGQDARHEDRRVECADHPA